MSTFVFSSKHKDVEYRSLVVGMRMRVMIILLLFLQKQNLALAVYLFGSVLSLPD